MVNQSKKKNVTIQQVLTALLDREHVFPPAYLHQFSDLEGADLEALRSIWPQVHPQRRYSLLEDLEELAEVDTLVSFDQIARLGLTDTDPRVRTVAIRLLWEDEDPRLVPIFLQRLFNDEDTGTRAAAATALGQFIYLGEIEEIEASLLNQVEDALLGVLNSEEEALVRRRSLESMGFSGRPEVPPLLRQAYNSGDPDWMSSALFAMGRSADPAWTPEVKRMLRHAKVNVQLEAVRAAGELQIDTARRALLDLLEEEAQDSEVRPAVIWSLSQIGGDEVRETLEQILEETDDDEEAEWVEKALENLTFTEDVDILNQMNMFDFTNLGETDREVDLQDFESGLEDAIDREDEGDSSQDPPRKAPGRPRHRPH